MPDAFLSEVRRLHKMRQDFLSLPDHLQKVFAQRIGDGAARDWVFQARTSQLPPQDLDWCWLLLGGRGMGKTRSLSASVHMAVRAGVKRMHFIAPTTADFHHVNLEGESGIFATCGNDERPRWTSTKRRLDWSNGAQLIFFSGEEPESLRGPQAQMCFVDEIAKMRYQQQVWDMMMMGLRIGDKPRAVIATTPKTTPLMKRLLTLKGISITTGSTYDNAKNLAPSFIQKMRDYYEGTRLGRQELYGAMILDPVNALFLDQWFVHEDVPESKFQQVSVGVDPSGGGDEIGIVVTALLDDGRFAVIADRTTTGSPATWGEAVVKAHDDFDADDVVVEVNYGGVMAAEVIRQTAERLAVVGKRENNTIRIKNVNASRGKAMRAEPVSLLYEKNRVVHRRGLNKLEAEMLSFSREWNLDVDGSPNRLDAVVWGLTRLSKVITDIPMSHT